MKRFIPFTLFGVLLATDTALSNEAPHSTQTYLEIAVYAVKDVEAFPALQAQAHQEIAQLPGFLHSLRLKSYGETVLFADVIAWRSPEAAEAASQQVSQDPKFANFMKALGDMKLFAHYWSSHNASELLPQLQQSPVVEIAAYSVPDPQTHELVHRLVHQKLPHQSGFRLGTPLQSAKGDSGYGDLIGWDSLQAFEQVGKKMMQDPELKAFFNPDMQMQVFTVFAVL